MAGKKELPKRLGRLGKLDKLDEDFKPKAGTGALGKLSGTSSKVFGVVKFIIGICFLPLVYTTTTSFLNEFSLVNKALQGYFCNGIISFLIIYLFVWEPTVIYTKGQQILEVVFRFFAPLVRVAPFLFPIYTLILLAAYGLLSLAIKDSWLLEYALFLFGFTLALHLVFSAKTIRTKKEDFLKGNYIFGFSFIYFINLMFLGFCFNLIFKEFSFVNFTNNTYSQAGDIFNMVFRQLFWVK